MDYSELDDSALLDCVALRVVANRDTVEDITFDVFIRVWERAASPQALH